MTISAVAGPDQGRIAASIERALLLSLTATNRQAANRAIVLEARNAGGSCLGGLTASTSTAGF